MKSWKSMTYDELPALSIRGAELRHSLRSMTLAWMFGIAWMSCVSGSPLITFTTMLGFNNFDYGLLTAIPYIATLAQLFATVFIERTGFKKYQFLTCATTHRLLWILIALVPLLVGLNVPSRSAVWLMLGIYGLSCTLNALGQPAVMTWMGDIVPRRIRGRYFAYRWMVARPIQIIVVIALGVILDSARNPSLPETFQAQPTLMWIISAVFSLAALSGAADILLFRRIREVVAQPMHGASEQEQNSPLVSFDVPRPGRWTPISSVRYVFAVAADSIRMLLLNPLKDKAFRGYVLFGATITFAVTVPGQFFWLNADQNLHFSKLAMNFLFMVVSPVLGLLGVRYWGQLLDRWGRRPVLIVASLGTWLSILPWFFATYDTPAPRFITDFLYWASAGVDSAMHGTGVFIIGPGAPVGAYMIALVTAFFGGIAWTGVQLAQNNIVLGFADGRGRSTYIAASSVLISVGGVLGGVLGGVVASVLSSGDVRQICSINVGPFQWNQWHATFAISFVVRLVATFWVIRMPEPGAASTGEMVRNMTANVYNNMSSWLFAPLRAFGWGRDKADKSPFEEEDDVDKNAP